MIWTHQVPTTNMTWDYVWGEVIELFEEVIHFNLTGIIEELCDVYTCGACAITRSTGIPVPIVWELTYIKYLERVEFFKWYLNELGLDYKLKYLVNGANYDKGWKRIRAVRLAIQDQYRKE